MPRPTIAHLTFPNSSKERGPMRIISSKAGGNLIDVVVANPARAKRMGDNYDWTDARDITDITPDQLIQLLGQSGVIFEYSSLVKTITPIQEVLPAVT